METEEQSHPTRSSRGGTASGTAAATSPSSGGAEPASAAAAAVSPVAAAANPNPPTKITRKQFDQVKVSNSFSLEGREYT